MLLPFYYIIYVWEYKLEYLTTGSYITRDSDDIVNADHEGVVEFRAADEERSSRIIIYKN